MKKRILSTLLCLVMQVGLLPVQHVHADWEEGGECGNCGAYIYGDWVCDCGYGGWHCSANSDHFECYEEYHCVECGEFYLEGDRCEECGLCYNCVGDSGVNDPFCPDCNRCIDCVPEEGFWFCSTCGRCADCTSDGKFCEICDQCYDCGGSGASAYAITVADAANGTVTADRKTASSGTTVTVTVVPDKGYTLETLTVLDKSGKEVALTDKGSGKYTFQMPASSVTVKATFMDDNTMLNFFVDVPADAYFADAVLWAVENGITKGATETTFDPNTNCTRAQIVTFIYRCMK